MDATGAARSSPDSPTARAVGGAGAARVLLVDDSPANLLALTAVLEPLRVELHTAASGQEALRLLLHQDYAVVVLDVNLPGGVSGFEVARLLRERERSQHTPLIFVTGKELAPGSISQGYAHGAVDYLLKPVDPDALRSKVSVFVELHRMREELRRQAEVIRQQERTLLEQQQRARLHQLLTVAPAAIIILRGEELVYEFANPLAERIAGRPLTLGRPLAEVLPDLAAQDELLQQLRGVLRTGQASAGRRVPVQLDRHGDGRMQEAFFDITYLPERGPDGRVEGVIGFAVDVTEQVQGQRRAETLATELRDSEELFRNFFGLSGVSMVQADPATGRLVAVNAAFCRLLGYEEAELLGRTVASLSPPEAREQDQEQLRRLVRGEIPFYAREKGYVRKDGSICFGYVTATLLRGSDGRVLRVAAVVQDLTERKAAEAARDAGEHQLRLLTDALPVLVSYVDPQQRYRQVNRAYETWFGREPGHMVDRSVRDVIGEPAYAAVKPRIEAALRGEFQTFEQEMRYPEGVRHVRALYIPHRLPSGEVAGFIGLVTDITEQVAQARERSRLLEEAQAGVRLRDEFFSVASHELRTPVTSLGLQLQLLARALPPDSRERARLATAERQVGRLATLIGSMLDVSRLAQGRIELQPAPAELGALTREALERLEPVFREAGSEVSLELPGREVHGVWDVQRVDQVLVNLLSNAAKYGGGGPVHVRVSEEAGRARLTVRDRGIGIPPEVLPRLFGRFERGVSDRHYGGLGLGLYISRQLVEAMGGRIHAQSSPEQGTAFTVELPLGEPPLGELPQAPGGGPSGA